jgi:hypothetical protein
LVNKKVNKKYPKVEHFVLFDSPQGGVKMANSIILRARSTFWAEPVMNGISNLNNTKPNVDDRGWNYNNILDPNYKHLLLSAEDEKLLLVDGFIAPDGLTGTALGRGRIMKPLSIFSLFDIFGARPNGYCERFIGGWGLQVFENPNPGPYEEAATHSIQTEPIAFVAAARFIAHSNIPRMGTYDDPGAVGQGSIDLTYGGGACQDDGSAYVVPSQAKLNISAAAGTHQDEIIYFDTAGTLVVSALLTDPGASLISLDSGGGAIPHMNEVEEFPASGGKAVRFELNVTPGQGFLRLSAAAVDTDALVVIDYQDDRYATVSSTNLHNLSNADVTIQAAIIDTGAIPLTGTSGTGRVVVTKPDGSEIILPLHDDGLHGDGSAGDGIYGANLSASEKGVEGRYSLFADLKVDTGSGIFAHRTGEGMFFVDYDAIAPLAFVSEESIDDDGNGLTDAIELAANFDFGKNGSFTLDAKVISEGLEVDHLRSAIEITNAPEVNAITLRIPAKVIQEAGTGNPLTLTEINLFENTQSLFVASLPDYTTQSFTLADFELPPLPVVVGCLPGFGSHTGGYKVLINGRTLDNVSEVYFGTELAPDFDILNDSAISVTVPAWDGTHEKVIIKVVDSWRQYEKSDIFEYYTSNQPPQLSSIGSQLIHEGQLLEFTVSSSDPEGDPLVLSSVMGNGDDISTIGADFIDHGDGTGTFSWTPDIAHVGDHVVKFEVVDDGLLNDYEIVLITVLANDIPGDLDNDGDVDSEDLALFALAFGSVIGDPNYNPAADMDNDGGVDGMDLVAFKNAYAPTIAAMSDKSVSAQETLNIKLC